MGQGVELRTNVKYKHAKVDQSVSLPQQKIYYMVYEQNFIKAFGKMI